jgi:hypothetical protein
LLLLSTSSTSASEFWWSTGLAANRRIDLGDTQFAKLQVASAAAISKTTQNRKIPIILAAFIAHSSLLSETSAIKKKRLQRMFQFNQLQEVTRPCVIHILACGCFRNST